MIPVIMLAQVTQQPVWLSTRSLVLPININDQT